MAKYELHGSWYTSKELSEMSGIAPATIRDRIRRGYSVEQAIKITTTHESVEQFSEASWWEDWVDMPINDLHKIYWKWCISQGYTPLPKQSFSRQLLGLYPQLKTVPINQLGKCQRVIRLRR